MQAPAYTVQLPVFEGPLDLLLHLIERAELDITRVALAQVTDQFLGYLRAMQDRRMDLAASFVVVAARLLQIKSEALLPRPPEREAGEEDPGDALARQLRLYKQFKDVAMLLHQREEAGLRTFLRLAPPPKVPPRFDWTRLSLAAPETGGGDGACRPSGASPARNDGQRAQGDHPRPDPPDRPEHPRRRARGVLRA